MQELPETICQKGEEKTFSCTLSVLTKFFGGPKQPKPGNTIKKWFQSGLPKPKIETLFWGKVFCGMGDKVGFTNNYFGTFFDEKTKMFLAQKHKLQPKMLKNRHFMKLWVVFEHGKVVFWLRCFVTFLVCGGWLCGVCL